VAIQSLTVRFAIDRAGLVGADGAPMPESFDNAILGCLRPHMAPFDDATSGRDWRENDPAWVGRRADEASAVDRRSAPAAWMPTSCDDWF